MAKKQPGLQPQNLPFGFATASLVALGSAMLLLRVLCIAASLILSGFSKAEELKLEQEKYVPPAMADYPASYEEVMLTLAPYYHAKRPLDYFFELYVLSVLGYLPEKSSVALIEFSEKHPSLFLSTSGDWRAYVVKELHLSEAIEIAIWDLWIRNSRNAKDNGWNYHPWHFAKNFLENYSAEGSRVDVWEAGALEAAKQRIEIYRNGGN